MSDRFVILLDGTIGVGKSTMGRQLALRFGGSFVDGDDHKTKGKPWYCSSLKTCRSILGTSIQALEVKSFVFISRPVRCLDWLYFNKHFEQTGTKVHMIGLQASFENITNEARGRAFSQGERERMTEMISEGYGARSYSDFYMRTDRQSIEATVNTLEARLRTLTNT